MSDIYPTADDDNPPSPLPSVAPSPGGSLPVAPAGAIDSEMAGQGLAGGGLAGRGVERQGEAFDPLLAMIERASANPAVDISKFESLWRMAKERRAELAEIEFNAAFAELLPKLPVIDQKGKIKIYSKADRDRPNFNPAEATPIQVTAYAKFEDILETVVPVLAENGFGVRFEFDTSPAGDSYRIVARAFLMHRAGHSISTATPPLMHDATGSKNSVQAVGSTLSYAKRYAMLAVLPIVSHAPEDADDDAEGSGKKLIGVDEIAFIEQQLRDKGGDLAQLLAKVGAPSLDLMTEVQYRRALEAIDQRARAMKRRAPAS